MGICLRADIVPGKGAVKACIVSEIKLCIPCMEPGLSRI